MIYVKLNDHCNCLARKLLDQIYDKRNKKNPNSLFVSK